MRKLGNNENVLITRRPSSSSDGGGGGGGGGSEWILTVRRATARDAGVYEARASNGQGTVARSWAIKVEIPRTTTNKVREEDEIDFSLHKCLVRRRIFTIGALGVAFNMNV